jgi:hypothetical protein
MESSRTLRFPARITLIAVGVSLALALAPLPAWAALSEDPDPTCQVNGRVTDILYMANTVYIVGSFTEARPAGVPPGGPGSVTRNRAVACNATTGEIRPQWNPNLDARAWRLGLAPAGAPGAGSIYIGGEFVTVGGVTRRKAARVDAVTGVADSWNPNPASNVRALAVAPDGNAVYLGGAFLKVKNQERIRVAAVNATTGAPLAGWDPVVEKASGTCPPRCFPIVTALEVSSDGTQLYIGGTFGFVDGVARNSIAAVNRLTGALTSWYPHDPARPTAAKGVYSGGSLNQVYDIEALGNHVFVCGNYWALAGKPSPNVGAAFANHVDPNGARDFGWVATTDGAVNACAVDSSTLYVGGHFEMAGGSLAKQNGQPRMHVAAFAGTNGALSSWDPGANTKTGLYGLGTSATLVGIGGDFTKTGGGCAPPRGVRCSADQQGFAQYSPV